MATGKTTSHASSTPPPPSRAAIVDIKPSYGLFIDGEFVDGARQAPSRRSARRPRRCSPRSPRPTRPTSTWPSRPPAAPTPASGRGCRGTRARQVPLPDRPHHPGARPRARGARVDRQRQADQGVPRRRRPARRGALLLLRRLGRQARVRRLRHAPAAGRRRPGHPVELPAAHAGVEDRARAGLRQHRRAQAGRDHAADRAAVRGDLPAGRPAAGRRQHRHRRRRDRPGARRAPRRRQGRLHRLDRRRPGDRASRSPASHKKVTLELGGKAANIVFDDAPIDQAVEGIVNGIFFNQGHVCCAGLAAAGAGVGRRRGARAAQAPDGDAARRRPARQEHRHRRHQLRRAAGQDPRALRHRRGRGRRPLVAAVRAARATASGSRRRSSPASPRPTGSPARRSSARCCRC